MKLMAVVFDWSDWGLRALAAFLIAVGLLEVYVLFEFVREWWRLRK